MEDSKVKSARNLFFICLLIFALALFGTLIQGHFPDITDLLAVFLLVTSGLNLLWVTRKSKKRKL